MNVYLDHNATSPLRPEALEAMLPILERGSANPSSQHRDGQRARLAIEEAREEVSGLLGARTSEVVFTSGGTESANAALAGVAWAAGAALGEGRSGFAPGASIVTSSFEHPAVHRTLRGLEARGLRVERVAPDREGLVPADAVLAKITAGTLLVSVMHVNNEIGTIQPIAEIAEAAAARGVPMHTDAVQALGKIPLCERVALMSVSAHKIGGPQGVGALVVRGGAALEPLVRGGPQERRRRAGTENVAGIVGFGAAARAVAASLHGPARIAVLRDRLEADLLARYDGIVIHGRGAPRVGNTSCFSLRGADGVTLQVALDLAGFSVSTGTACASGTTAPSYVLKEIGALAEVAKGAIRVSLGWNSTGEDIAAFLQALHGIVAGTHQGVSAAMPDRETVH